MIALDKFEKSMIIVCPTVLFAEYNQYRLALIQLEDYKINSNLLFQTISF